MTSTERALRVGIVGYGYAGEVIHAPLIEAVEGLELVAVSTSRTERRDAARRRGLEVFASADELITSEGLDLVVVATPHDTHHRLVTSACRAGRHVVVDKLMALDVPEAGEMIREAREAGVVLSVFHNRRWDGDFLLVREMLQSGEFRSRSPGVGSPIMVRAWVHSPGPPNPRKWRGQASHGGGIFSDWGAHLLDQALHLYDSPVANVSCRMLHAVPGVDVETGASCEIEFENGIVHRIETHHLYHEASKGYELWSDAGRVVITGFDPRENMLNEQVLGTSRRSPGYSAVLYDGAEGQPHPIPAPPAGDWGAFYRNIVGHLRSGEPLAITPESVLRTMKLRQAALSAAADRRIVHRPLSP